MNPPEFNTSPMPKHGDFIKGAKVKIAHFNDQLQYCAKLFVEWINSLEDYFSWHKIEDLQHVAFVKNEIERACKKLVTRY